MTIRVLLADDHAIMRDGLKALLSVSPDISVVAEVGNGRDAVRRTLELKPDVVIMDISMPGLNGVEAARLIRDKCPGTRIVMLSMHSSSEHEILAAHSHIYFAACAQGFCMGAKRCEQAVIFQRRRMQIRHHVAHVRGGGFQ